MKIEKVPIFENWKVSIRYPVEGEDSRRLHELWGEGEAPDLEDAVMGALKTFMENHQAWRDDEEFKGQIEKMGFGEWVNQ